MRVSLHTAVQLETLLNRHIHTLVKSGLEQFPERYPVLFSLDRADIWKKVLPRLLASDGLTCVRRTEAVVYQWAIAPQISSSLGVPAQAIAQSLVDLLVQPPELPETNDPSKGLEAQIWIDCRVRGYAHQLVQVEVSDRALSTWLQHVISPTPETAPEILESVSSASSKISTLAERSPATLFPLQAAHARCCSLLRLGEREHLITLHPATEHKPPQWIVAPCPLPWLQEDGQLRLCHPSERHLLRIGVELLGDCNVSLSQISALREQFHGFEASCRVLGQVKTDDPSLAQVRLGLILLIRYCLAQWLECHGVQPLQEL